MAQDYLNNMRYLEIASAISPVAEIGHRGDLLRPFRPIRPWPRNSIRIGMACEEFVPCFIFNTDEDLARTRTRGSRSPRDGTLTLLDII